MKYDKLCEMQLDKLMGALLGPAKKSLSVPTKQSCNIQTPIQPTDDIGKFGNQTDIQIKQTEEGGLEIDSKEMAIKISKVVYEAVVAFIKKGD